MVATLRAARRWDEALEVKRRTVALLPNDLREAYEFALGFLMARGSTREGEAFFASLTPAQLVCNGNTAAGGIGRDAAQRIWYRALTVYMTSNTNYAGARAATLSAAADLYGSGSSQYNGVASGWSAVGVN